MNCSLCIGHIRENKKCEGCNIEHPEKPEYCRSCIVTTCENRIGDYCNTCEDLPCRRIKQLDNRYRAKYGMSMIENLEFIDKHGIDAFIEKENEKWKCPDCGELFSVHRRECVQCGKEKDPSLLSV